ncbi:MAG: S-methyl-5-thioribose-1-phosphate isomerase [Bacteroidales bacterium]|jgi:S-methyl-5-thioribose-1-phosphate isomerase|nr:S-methyl-5-thioribose-1-phosphate isomerase [Bacteroidales bacterium]
MNVNGKHYRALWMEGSTVCMIDQNLLPFEFSIYRCNDIDETCRAIKTMITRGAGSIGAAGAYGMLQAIYNNKSDENLYNELFVSKQKIDSTRPTAVNLFYATDRVLEASKISKEFAVSEAFAIADECVEQSRKIGIFGAELIKDGYGIETHCNAGWLALVDYGSALSPLYTAHDSGKNIFVYVDETRPRSQGARLTAWELEQHGILHAIIPDNAGAHYMSKGKINIIITGADRIAANGDTANKIGTLEKAISAKYYGIPFYIAAPTSTIDLKTNYGSLISIEERGEEEVLYYSGKQKNGKIIEIQVANPGSKALNPAFDVTPAELITGIITEKGIINPDKESIKNLFL